MQHPTGVGSRDGHTFGSSGGSVKVTTLVEGPIRRLVHGLGYEISRLTPPVDPVPRDFEGDDVELWRQVAPYTMTDPGAVYVLRDATRYVVSNAVPGAIVECGVWRGGSMLAVAQTLLDLGKTDVDLYLFDTFEGMPEPTEEDVHWTGESAAALLAREPRDENSHLWAEAPLDRVTQVMHSVAYPKSRIHLVKGNVEDTIPDEAPVDIALLRLDTDWYASTYHELAHLYPRLARGGVLIIDDYGWWRGAGKATDEYFAGNSPAPLLVRIDDVGRRVAVKLDA